MSILDLFKKKPKVNGIIKYLNLEGWWLNELSDEEREIILNIYSPMGSENSIIEGEICSSSQTQLHFFWGLIGWFNKPELRHIAYKLISKAETFIDKSSEPLDVHFFYSTKLEVFYKDRDLRPNGLELAIQSCEQQIANAPAAATAFKQKYDGNLPAHKGYAQLAIILEKQKRYDEAISLCEKAKSQGWAGDWDKRIERCDKRAKA
ncbi:tetratricopeptide repeat protein [Halomonas sp. FeN2]|uniref:tetratricopeptide repeat protein n=1 Tax=Halomonas sp. FeN2 TaxID=2832500 RepID=UPI000C635708|nr:MULTISPECIES: tetratricopeptide repeat protein [unclassified Halomonas]MBF58673.1 hypothetical protein [Halomonas sp.]UBR50354.1 tetratricopeptide repeat protein [Halomonas sp. FeN2]|tara:strand:- start:1218 stop:1835 length:618 start_codon:yes stop_codon:yes gene_type:complete